jgi:hypothetical protein
VVCDKKLKKEGCTDRSTSENAKLVDYLRNREFCVYTVQVLVAKHPPVSQSPSVVVSHCSYEEIMLCTPKSLQRFPCR